MTKSILESGRNCHSCAPAERLGVLIEGEAYYAAFREAVKAARRQIVIVGWDLHTEIELVRGQQAQPDEDEAPPRLGDLIQWAIEHNQDLNIYILLWDYSVVYAAEREWKIFSGLLRNPPPRMHFCYDDSLPSGASHHQKIVLIDNSLAFSGGMDLSLWRWDTPEHIPGDERRKSPKGELYQPYHDLQWVMAGEAVQQVRSECEYRWQRATGKILPEPDPVGDNAFYWPEQVSAETRDTSVAFSRTYSSWMDHPEVFEVEQLFLDSIAAAEKFIYLENQYFSSKRIAHALRERLLEKGGPEIIIILNNDTEGTLEESTMGVMRDYFFQQLREADHENRLRLFYPVVKDGEGNLIRVYVHAKVEIVDHRFLRIGSSNLSNRSMRVDSEIDTSIEGPDCEKFIKEVFYKLLENHLGTPAESIASRVEEEESLCRVLDEICDGESKSLAPITCETPSKIAEVLSEREILDPIEPIDPRSWISTRVEGREARTIPRMLIRIVAGLLVVGAVGLGLSYWAWGDEFSEEKLEAWMQQIKANPGSGVMLFCLFIAAGLTGFPLNALLIASVIVFGPTLALTLGYAGAHVSAAAAFMVGRIWGQPLANRLSSGVIDSINHRLEKRGVISVTVLRFIPVAPFVIVNLAAGSSRVKMADFHLGTLFGLLPGMAAVVLLTNQVKSVVVNPDWTGILLLAALVVLIGFAIYKVRKLAERNSD